MLDLNEITAACEAATPGPWRRVDGPTSYDYATLHDADDILVTHINKQHSARDANIDFIARARTWLPALVKELTQAREELATVNEVVSEFYAPSFDYMQPEIKRLRAEIERLRALVPPVSLLRCLADYECAGRHTVAQQALALARRIEEDQAND